MSEPDQLEGRLGEQGVTPLASWRVFWLVLRLAALRVTNRLAHFVRWGKKKSGRTATAPKRSRAGLFLALLGANFIFQGVSATSRLIANVARDAEVRAEPQHVWISGDTLSWLRKAEAWAGQDAQRAEKVVDYAIRHEVGRSSEGAQERELRRVFAMRGSDGFRVSRVPTNVLWPGTDLWLHDHARAMLPPLALMATLLGLAVILSILAASERNFAEVGARTEWLFSFPVRARSLFLAQAASAVLTPLLVLLLWPFFGAVYWSAGFGPLGFLLALLPTVAVGLLAGALRVALETTLRRTLSAKGVARVQAALGALSAVFLVLAVGLTFSTDSGRVLRLAARFDGSWLHQPLALPIWISLGGRPAWFAAGGSLFVAAAVLAVAVRWSEFMVRDGLVSQSSAYGGARRERRASLSSRARSGLFAGVVRKDLLALLRDRQVRTQALITPGLLLAVQVLVNPRIFEGLSENPRALATAAFGVSAFVLLGSCHILAGEVPTLWLLQCFPERLERVLLKKAAMWGILAMLYACVVFAVLGARSPALVVRALPYLVLILPGAVLFAAIGLGIGALGTNTHEAEPRRRVGASAIYLFMAIVALFAVAIHSPSWWAKLADLSLSALLAFALLQKLRDRLPFLLDPSAAPAAQISVADGIMAALAFFGLQSAVAMIIGASTPLVQTLLYAFVSAGAIVTVCGLWFLKSSGLRDPFTAVGFRHPTGIGASVRALGFGIAVGAAAALFASGYLAAAKHIGFMKQAIDQTLELQRSTLGADSRWLLLALVVIAAPLFEEFIFRGLLFSGFRRSIGALPAALASATVFALVHPAIAALPVFVLAVGAALLLERTRWLGAPIAAHMTYNAIVAGIPMISS